MASAIPTVDENPSLARPETGPSRTTSLARTVLPVLVLLVAGGLVRVGLWLWFAEQPLHIYDEQEYNTLALNLAQHGEFAFAPGKPASLRPPLYPALVAAIYGLAGMENFQAVRLVQLVLSLATALVLYFLGCRVYSPRTGLWLCGFYCFYPSLLGYNNLLLTEVLFTFLLCAAIYTLVVSFQQESIRYLWLAGVLLGLGALTRSILWLFPPFVVLLLLATLKTSFKWRLVGAGTLLLAFGGTIAPWAIRTSVLEKTFVPIDTMGGRNFMMGNYEFTPLHRAWDAISLEGEQHWFHQLVLVRPEAQEATQGQRDKLALRAGLQFARDNPGLTAKRDVVKFFNFWGLERELVAGAALGYFGPISRPGLLLLSVLIFGSYAWAMLAGVFGGVLAPPPDRRLHALLVLVIAFICLLHVLVFAHSRYHIPVIPLVLLYAAQAWVQGRALAQHKGQWSYWLAGGLAGLLLLGWGYEITVVELNRFLNLVNGVS